MVTDEAMKHEQRAKIKLLEREREKNEESDKKTRSKECKLCTRCNIKFHTYEDRLDKLGLESLKSRRIKTDLTFLYKIVHNYVDIDFNTFFQINTFSGHNLRRHQFHIERHKTTSSQIRSSFFTHRVIKYWNGLPESIINSVSLESFKSRLRQWNPP